MKEVNNFSVLLSVYNGENPDFLKESLTSIVKQSKQANQIVIVKDGELNEKLEMVIEDFVRDYRNILVVGYPNNQGLGRALSYGLDFVDNEIVIRCDSDDINRLNRFEKLTDFLIQNELDLVSCHVEEFEFVPLDLGRIRKVPVGEYIGSSMYYRNPLNHMAVAFRKSAAISCGGYRDMKGFEDYYLWLRFLTKDFKVNNLDEVLVDARVGNDMIGRRIGLGYVKSELNFQLAIYHELHHNFFLLIRNLLLRCAPRLLPKRVLAFIYLKNLRIEKGN